MTEHNEPYVPTQEDLKNVRFLMQDHQRLLELSTNVAQAYRRHQKMNDKGGFLQAVWKLADYLEPQK